MCNILVTTFMLSFFAGEIKLRYAECDIQPKVIGGTEIGIIHRPHIVSVHHSHYVSVCGGVIVSPRWILTALHCIPKPEEKTHHYIRVGTNFWDRGGFLHVFRDITVFNSSKVIAFNSSAPTHDIALVKVAPRFQFSSSVRPARLPKRHGNEPDKLWVTGWGLTNLTVRNPSIHLKTADLKKTSIHECKEHYPILVNVERHLCYGGVGKASYYGDSGGPLGNKHTVYGIVSFGHECGILPGGYVKLSYYWKWIRRTITGKR